MPEKKIILLYSNLRGNEKKAFEEIKDVEGKLLYFGRDYINLKRLESTFGNNFETINISRKLDEVSEILRGHYNDYFNKINRYYNGSFEWWFTPLSTRNIYLSGVFQNACYLELLKDICRDRDIEYILVVVESYSTGKIIEKWAKESNISLNPICRPYHGILRVFSDAIYAVGKSVLKSIIGYSLAKYSKLKSNNQRKNKNPDSSKKTALVDVFVYESNFENDGSFRDRFFPGLESYLINNGFNVIYRPVLTETRINKYTLFKKMRENERTFILAEDNLSISDYLLSIVIAIKVISFFEKMPLFRNFDISFADKYENKWVHFDNIYRSILDYHLFLNLGKKSGNNIDRIICWHENQLQNKALSLAVHQSFQGTKIIGVQHFIHFSNYLSLYILDSEAESLVAPDIVLTTGIVESDKVKKHLTTVPVTESAALRYSSVFNKRIQNLKLNREILLMLPYDRNDAFEIMTRVGQILPHLGDKAIINVKCHPDYNKEIFSGILAENNWYGRFDFQDKSLDELLHSSALVISMASGSIVETAVSGVPTILLAKSNALNLNPFDFDDYEFITVCYDLDSLKSSIDKYLSYSVDDRKQATIIGEQLRNKFFTSLSEENMEVFIS